MLGQFVVKLAFGHQAMAVSVAGGLPNGSGYWEFIAASK